MPTDAAAAGPVAAPGPRRPIRPAGAPPRPGSASAGPDAGQPDDGRPSFSAPDDATVVRPQPVPLPRRVLRDEPLVPERLPSSRLAAPAVPPSRSAPATAPVRTLVASAPAPSAPPTVAATVLTHHTIGRSAGQLDLGDARWSGGPSSRLLLESRVGALPELDDDMPARRLTRQPAFIASMAAAVVVIVVVVVLILMQTVFRAPDRVENLQLLDGGANYVLQWNGPNVPYSVEMTAASTGKNVDVSSLIRGGREAWIPKNGAEVTDRSCFIVRSQGESASKPLPTTSAALSAQGAARVCVSQVSSN